MEPKRPAFHWDLWKVSLLTCKIRGMCILLALTHEFCIAEQRKLNDCKRWEVERSSGVWVAAQTLDKRVAYYDPLWPAREHCRTAASRGATADSSGTYNIVHELIFDDRLTIPVGVASDEYADGANADYILQHLWGILGVARPKYIWHCSATRY